MTGDNWQGDINNDWRIEHPSLIQIREAVRQLNERNFTLVTIGGPGSQHLAVGGGAGRYVVYATFDNHEFWNLVGQGTLDIWDTLTAGGQEGDYPARQIVDLESAEAAACTFAQQLQLEPTLRWEKQ